MGPDYAEEIEVRAFDAVANFLESLVSFAAKLPVELSDGSHVVLIRLVRAVDAARVRHDNGNAPV